MSIIFSIDKTCSKPNPAIKDAWFMPIREKCHLCNGLGRKPIYKTLHKLYYHYASCHRGHLEAEWRQRIEQLLKEVRK